MLLFIPILIHENFMLFFYFYNADIFLLGYIPSHLNQVVRHLKTLYNHHYYVLKEESKKDIYRLSITLDF